MQQLRLTLGRSGELRHLSEIFGAIIALWWYSRQGFFYLARLSLVPFIHLLTHGILQLRVCNIICSQAQLLSLFLTVMILSLMLSPIVQLPQMVSVFC